EPNSAGLIYYRARYYQPHTGRFTQPDPKGFIDGINRYAYAVNSPVNYSDPYGTSVIPREYNTLASQQQSYYSTPPTTFSSLVSEFQTTAGAFGNAVCSNPSLQSFAVGSALGGGAGLATVLPAATTAAALTSFNLGMTASGEMPVGGIGGVANSALKQLGRSIDDLSSVANQTINKEGLTAAARALAKHATGQRGTGTFPKLKGGIAEQNKAAQQIVDDILGNSNSSVTNLSRGGLEVRAPDGRGIRFNSDGKLSGFLDPRK
ncbi:MAG: RHS repeat-associated core domain-containing protein, partial [Gammaproteobacteria bacterium]|nr:RHS repeat-associated core domain-containing protein [Gammaproteobacteria bacterium]